MTKEEKIRLAESIKIENTAKCPYGEKIVLAALKKLKEKDLLSIGKTLEIIDWDLDNVCISDKEKFAGKEPDEDYAVRMWNIREVLDNPPDLLCRDRLAVLANMKASGVDGCGYLFCGHPSVAAGSGCS